MAEHKTVMRSFCTTREAAEMLGVSLRTAQLWSESGLLEAWKTSGGHRRISRQSVDRLLSGNPTRFASARAPAPVAEEADATPRFKVLVVEDDPVLRRLYELNLRQWPMKPDVQTAGDGYEALVLLGLRRPDMLIADLHMPGLDGFRMLRTIHGSPELAGMTTVVVSGLDAAEIAARGSVPPDIPILPKPVPFDQLAAIASRHATQRGIPSRANINED